VLIFSVVALLSSAGSAQALTTDSYGARDALVRANLKPNPYYPRTLPGEIGKHAVKFSHKGKLFSFVFTALKKQEPGFVVSYSRLSKRSIKKLSKSTKRVAIKKLKLGSRTVYSGRSSKKFYLAWKQQGFTYYLSSKNKGGVTQTDLGLFVLSLEPLGDAYDGMTSQGKSLDIYVSPHTRAPWFGYSEEHEFTCANVTTFTSSFRFDYGGNIQPNESFASDPSYSSIYPPTGGVARSFLNGDLDDGTASGSLRAYFNGDRDCDTGPVTWYAVKTAGASR
jgi:hypothetical protein